MLMTEWDKEVGKLSKEDLQKYTDAMETLLSWPVFLREYKMFGVRLIRDILKFELKGRKKGIR